MPNPPPTLTRTFARQDAARCRARGTVGLQTNPFFTWRCWRRRKACSGIDDANGDADPHRSGVNAARHAAAGVLEGPINGQMPRGRYANMELGSIAATLR